MLTNFFILVVVLFMGVTIGEWVVDRMVYKVISHTPEKGDNVILKLRWGPLTKIVYRRGGAWYRFSTGTRCGGQEAENIELSLDHYNFRNKTGEDK